MDSWRHRAPPRVHPCICGFTCWAYAKMRRHRLKCVQWERRSDRAALARNRRAETCTLREKEVREVQVAHPTCIECRSKLDHHQPGCSQSHEEKVRREMVKKNDIDPKAFEVLLQLLVKYPAS